MGGIFDEVAKALISEGIKKLPEAGVFIYEKGVEFKENKEHDRRASKEIQRRAELEEARKEIDKIAAPVIQKGLGAGDCNVRVHYTIKTNYWLEPCLSGCENYTVHTKYFAGELVLFDLELSNTSNDIWMLDYCLSPGSLVYDYYEMIGGSLFGEHKEGSKDEKDKKILKEYALDKIKFFISNWGI